MRIVTGIVLWGEKINSDSHFICFNSLFLIKKIKVYFIYGKVNLFKCKCLQSSVNTFVCVTTTTIIKMTFKKANHLHANFSYYLLKFNHFYLVLPLCFPITPSNPTSPQSLATGSSLTDCLLEVCICFPWWDLEIPNNMVTYMHAFWKCLSCMDAEFWEIIFLMENLILFFLISIWSANHINWF